MALDQWSRALKDNRLEQPEHSESIEFASGLILSVQASSMHMCSPKNNDPAEGWNTFEVWSSSRMTGYDVDILRGTIDESSYMIEPVGYVNIKQLDRVASNNGGILP